MTDSSQNQMPDMSRRKLMGVAAAGVAAATVAGAASAQTTRAPGGGAFDGRTVLITGATSGIGAETAREFARQGGNVHFCGRREALGKGVENDIKRMGGQATYTQIDVRDHEALKSWIDRTASRTGRLDVAFNNAGMAIPPGPTENVTPDNFAEIIDTNLGGIFWAMNAEIPHMKRQGSGVIINTSSAFGSHAPNTQVPYGATKGAVDAMTEGVAKEVGGDGIRVLAVAPGVVVDTDLFRFMGRDYNQEELEQFRSLASMGKVGKPMDIAEMVVMLASGAGGFVHGTTVAIDGQFLQA